MTTIDADIAAYKRLAEEYNEAAARFDAEFNAGGTGYEAFANMAALGEKLARAADALKGRIDAAQRAL
ncbi:hypothetical protein [Sphingomonas sp. 1185]|uniref:hypothetical protein n=1 Tax=Sphingomonas sp. 1185 TaxID=3156411 RepID=UPI0033998519